MLDEDSITSPNLEYLAKNKKGTFSRISLSSISELR